MIGVAITNICNLKCSYCFAQHVTKEEHKIFMDPQTYKNVLEFIKADPNFDGCVGICGGEPTVNPYFGEILKIVINDPFIQHIMVYTNGINADKYIDLLTNPKIGMLINLNPPSEIGEYNYNRIDKFLEESQKRFSLKLKSVSDYFSLGINISSNDFDYQYAIDLCKKYKMHNLRASITTKIDDPQLEILDYFKSRKDSFLKFVKDCDKADIVPGRDCNPISRCCWNEEELAYLEDFDKRHNLENTQRWSEYSTCDRPVVTILPDLTSINCFALDGISKKKITEFKHAGELQNYYINFINAYNRSSYTNKECKECAHRLNGDCGMGCPAMRVEQIKKFIKLENNLLDEE